MQGDDISLILDLGILGLEESRLEFNNVALGPESALSCVGTVLGTLKCSGLALDNALAVAEFGATFLQPLVLGTVSISPSSGLSFSAFQFFVNSFVRMGYRLKVRFQSPLDSIGFVLSCDELWVGRSVDSP